MRAKITRRARTLTEGQPMAVPYCAANRPFRAENCLPMVVEHRSEFRRKDVRLISAQFAGHGPAVAA